MSYSQDNYLRYSENILDWLILQMNALSRKMQEDAQEYKQRIDSSANQGFMTNYTEILGGAKYQKLLQHIESMDDVISILRQEVAWQKQQIQDLRTSAYQQDM